MAGTHDTIVLVHGAGDANGAADSATQGRFLTNVAEPLVRWLADNGGEQLILSPSSIRRGPRPARLELSGRLPDPDRPGETRPFEWRIVEARWSDEYLDASQAAATATALRAVPNAIVDHLGAYDPAWRYWRALTGLSAPLGLLANAPAPGATEQAWRYRFDMEWPFPVRLLAALWLGVIAPLLFFTVASPFLLLASPLWLLTGMTAQWQRATWNGWYRLALAAAWTPVLGLAAMLLTVLLLLALLPFGIPGIGAARQGVLGLLRLRWLDSHAFTVDRVSGASIEEAVGSTIASELLDARSLTVIGFEQGAVVAYETLAALARPVLQPEVQNPYVTVSQALSAIDRPLPRYGLPVALITVGSTLNRALGARRRPLLRDPLPEGTRWVDIWSHHDPAPTGSVARRLIAASGGPLTEARVTNSPSPFAASGYWSNPEVAAVIAEEVIAASARPAASEAGPSPAAWEPRAAGTWEWRTSHGHADRACTLTRRARLLRTAALARLGAYAAVAWSVLVAMPADAALVEQIGAAVVPLGVGCVLATAVIAAVEGTARGVAEAWARRPCRHTRLMPNAVRL